MIITKNMATCDNISDNPVGPEVSSIPAIKPKATTLHGTHAYLARIDPSQAEALYPLLGGSRNAHLWDYMHDRPCVDFDSFQIMMEKNSASTDPLFFTIFTVSTQSPLGWASLMRQETPNRVIEIGSIMYSHLLQRSTAATEAVYLLMKHCFEDLGYRRVEWKCNNLNAPSKRAAQRLGFKFEGIFRKHLIVKGRNRDTAWFSVLDDEWGVVGRALKTWLEESNFDRDGTQRKRLEDIRDGLAKAA